MAEPFLSEIRIMSFSYAPRGWALCDGQLLPIAQNQALFSLLGTTFGGNGSVSFGLPDLRGRTAIHVGSGHTLGERGGEQAHTLSIAELPTHSHLVNATLAKQNGIEPSNTSVFANADPTRLYVGSGTLAAMGSQTITNVGGNQAHVNMQPYLTLSFNIALQGLFPDTF
jgi:microcystin-dependent protein